MAKSSKHSADDPKAVKKAKSKPNAPKDDKVLAKKAEKKTRKPLVEPPEDLGECCFIVDSKEMVTAVRNLVASGNFGGAKSDDFGDDGSGVQVLDNLLVRASDEELELVYTKMAVYSSVRVPASVFKKGEFVVASAVFSGLKFPAATVTITLKKTKVYFNSGAMSGDVNTCGEVSEIEALIPEKIKCTLSLTKQFVLDVATKLMFASFDTSLPSYGLPLHIKSRKGKLLMIACDNICAAMLRRKDPNLPDMSVTLPGSALIQIVKALGADEVKLGVSESMFHVRGNGYSIYHPIGVYEMHDIQGYIDEEVSKAEFDMEAVVDTVSLSNAVSEVLGINKLAKSNNIVKIDFAKATVNYSNDVAKLGTKFTKQSHEGNVFKHQTDGQKLLTFLSPMKAMRMCRLRIYDSRLFMFSEDDALVYIMPLQ